MKVFQRKNKKQTTNEQKASAAMYVRNKILKGNPKQLPLQSRICVPDIGKPHPCRRVWEKKYVAHRRESRDLRHLRKNPAQNRNDSLTKHNIKGFHLFLRGK